MVVTGQMKTTEKTSWPRWRLACFIVGRAAFNALFHPTRVIAILGRTFTWTKRCGRRGLFYGLKSGCFSLASPWPSQYQRWIARHETISPDILSFYLQRIESLNNPPRISIVLPTYESDVRCLTLAVESVRRQIYPHWELIVVDDASRDKRLKKYLEGLTSLDSRIRVRFREKNGHIARATNDGIAMTTGDWVTFLDHDDELSRDALYWIAEEVAKVPACDLIFTDEDKIDDYGRRFAPHFKSGWDLEVMYSFNLVTHLAVYRAALLKSLDGVRVGFEGAQDYDLVLRVSESTEPSRIRHIPRVLYHWRDLPTSTAGSIRAKQYAFVSSQKAIEEHLQRKNIRAQVKKGFGDYHRVQYSPPSSIPPAEFLKPGKKPATQDADILCFLDKASTIEPNDWLSRLWSHLSQPGVGAVGGKGISPLGKVLSAGIALPLLPELGSPHQGLTLDEPGYMARNQVVQSVSGLSADWLVTTRELFEKVGGWTPAFRDFPLLAGADYCLKLRMLGYRTVWTPRVLAVHSFESRSAPTTEVWNHFLNTWAEFLKNDPFFSANWSSLLLGRDSVAKAPWLPARALPLSPSVPS